MYDLSTECSRRSDVRAVKHGNVALSSKYGCDGKEKMNSLFGEDVDSLMF